MDWLIVGLFYLMLCRGRCCCWGLPACSLEHWRFSFIGSMHGKHDLVTLNASFWRGMKQLAPPPFSLFHGFVIQLLLAHLCFLLCAAKEGGFVDGLVTVSGCLHWTIDWFGYWDWSKVCYHYIWHFISVFWETHLFLIMIDVVVIGLLKDSFMPSTYFLLDISLLRESDMGWNPIFTKGM